MDTIHDFTAGAGTDDRIDLSGVTGRDDFADVLANSTDVGGDTEIELGLGHSVTLIGVAPSELHLDDFLF